MFVETPLIHEIEERLNNYNPEDQVEFDGFAKLAFEAKMS